MEFIASLLELKPINDSLKPPYPVTWSFTSHLSYKLVYVVCALGIPLNFLVIYISLIEQTIKSNYKYLLGNLALCDILCLLGLLSQIIVYLYLLENSLQFTPFSCTMYSVWSLTTCYMFLNALPLITIHRYVSVVLEKDAFFTNRVLFCMCLFVYWPLLYPVLTFAYPMYYAAERTCGWLYWFPFIRELLPVPVGILNIASVFCITKLFLYLRNHTKSIISIVDKARLRDERTLLITITVQTMLPILCFVPGAVVVVISAFYMNAKKWDQFMNIFGSSVTLLEIPLLLFRMNPVIDPLLTLFCVRPYRTIVTDWVRKCFVMSKEPSMEHAAENGLRVQQGSRLY